MIDNDGYRPNVGIIITNGTGQVMWARRYGQNSWQFPQGGINQGETPEEAMYRELYEEVGLKPKHVKILATSKLWLRYKLPKRMIRWDSKPLCIGQKQRWFLLELIAKEDEINMVANAKPEFDGYKWVTFWYPIRQVVSFKRDVYRRALKEFASIVQSQHALANKSFESKTYSFDKSKVNRHKLLDQNYSELHKKGGSSVKETDKQVAVSFEKEEKVENKTFKQPQINSLGNQPATTGATKNYTHKKKKRWPHRAGKKNKTK